MYVPYTRDHTLEKKKGQTVVIPPLWYVIFPVLPIILLLVFNLVFINPETGKPLLKVGLPEITLISMLIPIFIELIRKRNFKQSIQDFNLFF